MNPTDKERLLASFRDYLDRAENPDPQGHEADGHGADTDPDLFTLLAELAALKSEVKLESRQVKTALDEFRSLFDALRASQDRLDEERKRRREAERQSEQTASKDLLLELLDLRDRLEAGQDQAGRFRPIWFGRRSARAFVGSMAEGLGISLRRLDETLARQGVHHFEALHRRFDPHRMRANELADDPDRPEGQVVEELRKGFMLNDALLRPAEVRVNRPTRRRRSGPPRLNI
ncbi:nucleotide exchange factor GrpE [Imhoffiella purpurea]|uniref:Protein GrpE n=1 Tax=Imhoffiella purpurea TaxID=1249627 RepID=W9VI53_9GAMM|nr:nucleotide exchange factor GrpE [Imhoffiella purpurea]EXJ15732.1 Heat shock protein GrpE [Imhoffiella purpurea]